MFLAASLKEKLEHSQHSLLSMHKMIAQYQQTVYMHHGKKWEKETAD